MVKMYPVSNKMICFYQLFFFLPLLSLIIFVDKASASSNILLIVVDNLRPALSSYTNVEAKTPNMDSIGYGGTTFARAYLERAKMMRRTKRPAEAELEYLQWVI